MRRPRVAQAHLPCHTGVLSLLLIYSNLFFLTLSSFWPLPPAQTFQTVSEQTNKQTIHEIMWHILPDINPFRTVGTFYSSYNRFCVFGQHRNYRP